MKRTIASTKRTFTARITKPTITKTMATVARMARAIKMSFAFLSITKTSRNFGEENVTRLALAALFWQRLHHSLHRIQDCNFCALACCVDELVRVGFYLAFGQLRFDIFVNVFQFGHEASGMLAAKAWDPNVRVVAFDLFLRHDREGTETKVNILFYCQTLANNLSQLLGA